MCRFHSSKAFCPFEGCSQIHGEMCDFCGKFCLNPFDRDQQKQHLKECIAEHEKMMEIAFLIQRSEDKVCSICYEIVWEKPEDEQRFGILPNCNHSFCLSCIRKWRKADFDNKVIKSCPECRVVSEYVCPSVFWVSDKEEKEQLLAKFKSDCASRDCNFFKRGLRACPFGNECLYRHRLLNGRVVDVGPRVEAPDNLWQEVDRATAELLRLFDESVRSEENPPDTDILRTLVFEDIFGQ
jgi:E3 ubiquitin-protein ligase makorin